MAEVNVVTNVIVVSDAKQESQQQDGLVKRNYQHAPLCRYTERNPITCPVCHILFAEKQPLLEHLMLSHRVVIGDIEQIKGLSRYCGFWADRFKSPAVIWKDYMCTVTMNKNGESNDYFMLCDVHPEDKKLREKLAREYLNGLLECQQLERNPDPDLSRQCLFCKASFSIHRRDVFTHMLEAHGFNIGLPDNLVHIDIFLDKLQARLNGKQCLFCEKVFPDWQTLKSHIRKKKHYKINPKNPEYDEFYIVNYAEVGKNWQSLHKENARDTDTEEATSDWDDWNGEETPGESDGQSASCLFCSESFSTAEQTFQHTKVEHSFSFWDNVDELKLTFYQRVKLVNYIRDRIARNTCVYCEETFENLASTLKHLATEGHFKLDSATQGWDEPKYFFPLLENDALLCGLERDGDDPIEANDVEAQHTL